MGVLNEGFVEAVAACAALTNELRAALPHAGQAQAVGAAPVWLDHWLNTLRGFNAAALDVPGLRDIGFHVQGNLAAFAKTPDRLGQRQIALCIRLPDLLDAYLRGADIDGSVEALMDFAIDAAWPCLLGLIESAQMREHLLEYRVESGHAPLVGAANMMGPMEQDPSALDVLYAAIDSDGVDVRADLSEQSCPPDADRAASEVAVRLQEALQSLMLAVDALIGDDPARPDPSAVQHCASTLGGLVESCHAMPGARAWGAVLARLKENFWPFCDTLEGNVAPTVDPELTIAVHDVSQLLLALAEQPADAMLCDALLDRLASTEWSWPLPAAERAELREAFGFAAHAKDEPIPSLGSTESAFFEAATPAVVAPEPAPAAAGPHAAWQRLAECAQALITEDGTPPDAARLSALAQAVDAAIEPCATAPAAAAWHDVLYRLLENVAAITNGSAANDAAAFDPALTMALIDLPQLALTLLDQPDDALLCDALLDCLAADAWPLPLPLEELPALRTAFGLAPHVRHDPIPDTGAQDSAFAPMSSLGEWAEAAAGGPKPQRCDVEHLAVLSQEFAAFALGLQTEMAEAGVDSPVGQRRDALQRYGEMIQRVGETCAAVGLTALEEVFAQIALRAGLARNTGLTDAQNVWLRTIVQHVRAYLATPNDPSAAGAMVEVLADGSWPPALPGAEAARLETALTSVELFTDETLRPQRVREAAAADVSLALPADINPELLDGLLAELPLQSADFAGAMERVVSGQGSLYDLDVAKRAAHTLKGAANTVGVRGIASLTHHLEDVLIALTKFGAMPNRELTQVLVQSADCLEAMSEAVQGVAKAPADAQRVLQAVLDWANRFDDDGADALNGEPLAAATPAIPVFMGAADSAAAAAGEPAATDAVAGEQSASQAMLRVPAALVDELLRLVGETMIANTQIKEQLRQTNDHVHAVTKQNLTLQHLTAELETLVDIRGMSGQGITLAKGGEVMDTLEFERFNELHTVTRRLVEAATDSREMSAGSEERLKALAELLDMQGRLHAENQQAVVGTRMVPVSSVVSRLQRSVRQTCRLLDKPVDLHVKGDNTQLDVNILGELLDPLMHLLRNSIDHGIESAAARSAMGKAAAGKIELSFAREGASVVVRCSDDGAGLDLARIRAKALARGLIAEGQTLLDDELARIVLLPGFSTRDESTEVSGRGIGMDAVYSRVLQLKGSLRMVNRAGQGLTVELRVPTSLMTTHGVLVRVADQIVALTSFGISGINHVTADQVRKVGNNEVFVEGEQVHHLLKLDQLLGHGDRGAQERGWFPALMVQTDSGQQRAIQVQDVLDSQELVVKKLGKYVPDVPGVIGVTILGDGSVAPVLDLPQLLREMADGVNAGPRRQRSAAGGVSRVEARKSALVVDDSLSARRAVAQVMRDAGYDVRTAIDGMEAAAILAKMLPDIVIVDMEMPRMNGLELTTHIRSRDNTRHLPVVMITSRSTDKHRQMADTAGVDVYLTKPFNDDELERHVHRLTSVAKAA
jgi:chemotaxis protein histidine kinase CheA/ActR/RegA family two-component response regulator